jgi:hypothetical protein
MDTDVRNAIACVTVRIGVELRSRGTGFLVADDLAATALHVIANGETDPPTFFNGTINLRFPTHSTDAIIVDHAWDRTSDCVLLRCLSPPVAKPLALRDLQRSADKWETHGWANMEPVDGLVVDGDVTNHAGELNKVLAIQLYSKQLAAGSGGSANGLSGGPVIIDKAVVGLLRSALGKRDLVVAGTVYACPSRVIAALHPARLFVQSMPKIVTFLTSQQLSDLSPLFVAEFAATPTTPARILQFSLGATLNRITNLSLPFEKIVSDMLTWIHQQGEGPMEVFLHAIISSRSDDSALRTFCQQRFPRIFNSFDIDVLVQRITLALNSLLDMGSGPAIGEIVRRYGANFENAIQQIRILEQYKALHNCLHDLQFKLEVISEVLDRPASDAKANGKLRLFAIDLKRLSLEARAQINDLDTQTTEAGWIDALDSYINDMVQVADVHANVEERSQVLASLKFLLNNAARISSLLAKTAANLNLISFSEMMDSISQTSSHRSAESQGLKTGSAAVGTLRACVAGLVAEHFEWQGLSQDLEYAKASIKHQPHGRFPRWSSFEERLTGLCDIYPRERWSTDVKDAMTKWIISTPSAAPDKAEKIAGADAFEEFYRICMYRFYDVDVSLRTLSGKIAPIAVPLRALLGILGTLP